METKLEQFARLKEEKEMLDGKIKETKEPYEKRFIELQKEIDEATGTLTKASQERKEVISRLYQEIINEWDSNAGATVKLPNGVSIVRSTTMKLKVIKERELLERILELIDKDTELPLTVKWNDKKLLPLLDTSIISPTIASKEASYKLAVRRAKA